MMKRILFGMVAIVVLAALSTGAAAAQPERPSALDARGPLTKVTFIHYKRANAKPPWAGGGGGNTGASKCYAFLANGARWKATEGFLINPSNSYGLSDVFVSEVVSTSASQWNTHGGFSVFGPSSMDYTVSYNESTADTVNTLSFGPYPEANVIAVTNVWGYFSGPPQSRELVEWDMLLNTASSWSWGDATVDASLMDVENIVAHELGHAAGLGHPDSSCTQETMYAYSSEGETLKRSLNTGDIEGIKSLYK